MAVRKLKPVTPGQRHRIIGTFEEITASVPEKSLVKGKRSTGGRNNSGKMTVRYRGGGHKRKLRDIDFKREKDGVPATVTIQTARLVSLCSSMLMAKNVTLLLLSDCKWATSCTQVPTPLPKWAMLCHWPTFPWVR